MVQSLWRTVWRFLKKLKIELPHDPEISLLDRYPEKTIIEKNMCTRVFIAALFVIARTWKPEKAMATHSSTLAWRIPGTGVPGGLPSMGSHRVGHD